MPKYQVVWTRMARIDFDENIIYLLENWTERDARQFTKKSMSAIRIIQNNPYAFAATDYKDVRKVLVVKQTTLYYKLYENTIQLLRFWDNRRNTENLGSNL